MLLYGWRYHKLVEPSSRVVEFKHYNKGGWTTLQDISIKELDGSIYELDGLLCTQE